LNAQKKQAILSKLARFMPENRRSFWENIPENSESKDLSENLEHLHKE